MRLGWILFFAALTLAALGALAFVFDFLPASLQAPRVVAVEPADGATKVSPFAPITLAFSAPMSRAETQSAVSLTPRAAGKFLWRDAQTLVFMPRASLPISTTLTLRVATTARSWLGRSLVSAQVSQFTTLAAPRVVSSSLAPDARFARMPNEIQIEFSRALAENSLVDSIVVEPRPPQFNIAVAQTRVTLRGFFEPGARYQITIPKTVTDKIYGIPLERAYTWSFTVASQYPNFSILNRGRVMKFSARAPIEIPTQFTNVSRLDIALFPLTASELEAHARASFETWRAFQPTTAPLRTAQLALNAPRDTYARQKIILDALPRGAYYLHVTTPEGVSDAQLLWIQ